MCLTDFRLSVSDVYSVEPRFWLWTLNLVGDVDLVDLLDLASLRLGAIWQDHVNAGDLPLLPSLA